MTDDAKFATLVAALRPALGQLVIVGGWAHRLHRLTSEAQATAYEPLFTTDTDIVLMAGTGSTDLRARLTAHGFNEEFLGDDHPPITHYTLGEEAGGFYAEFLTPLIGGEHKRSGEPDVTARINGVIAQKLRYLDVLLIEPWSVTLGPQTELALPEPTTLRVPNPVCYIAQKLLINSRRHPARRAKDLLYIHDTIELFGGSLAELSALWRETVVPRLHPKQRALVVAEAQRLFGAVNDLIREAARIAPDRVSAPSLQALAGIGLDQVFSNR